MILQYVRHLLRVLMLKPQRLFESNLCIFPALLATIHNAVTRKEDEDSITVASGVCHPRNRLAKLLNHLLVLHFIGPRSV